MNRKLSLVAIVLLVLAGGAFLADRKLKGHKHPGLSTFIKQWWVNYPASFAVEPRELALHIDQSELEAIEAVVEAARERGVIMPEGNDYVPAELEFDGARFKAKVRIKGKMSDHVQGSKWSFRVVAKKNNGFLGMQRFSLQHPGTRNYLCDWFFHRLMKGEGSIALRYGFIRLTFNEEDLGVYAYEEHFGPELLAHNGRLKGPLFRFDPGLFWEHRLNMIEKVRYNEAFGTYQAAALDAFGTGDLEKDTVQRALFEEAVGRMDAFRRGNLRASEVFDAERLGLRHAMLDLVGGHHSMDWSDVKFYYDPVVKRIEPVAYESFSAFHIRQLAGSNRYVGRQEQGMDLHDAYFNDPVVFRAYVRHLERLSRPSYLDSAFTALGPALDSASALIYREFPYKELDRALYYQNQLIIRKILDVPKGFHAYSDGGTDTLRITIVPIEALPMEVHGLLASNGDLVKPLGNAIVPCRTPGEVGRPITMTFKWNGTKPGTALNLRYGVLGASVVKELEVFPYDYIDGLSLRTVNSADAVDPRTMPFLVFDEAARTVIVKPGAWVIESDVYIPSGYTVSATAPLRLDLRNGARIIVRSPMHWVGLEDASIVVHSSDGSGGGLVLMETVGKSTFRHVRFEGFGGTGQHGPAILVQAATAEFDRCEFGEDRGRDLVLCVRGRSAFTSCGFTGGRDQLSLAFNACTLSNVAFNGAGDDALNVKGGMLQANGVEVFGALGNGLKVDEGGEVDLRSVQLRTIKDAVSVAEGAMLSMSEGTISSKEGAALDVKAVHARHGATRVTWTKIDAKDAARTPQVGKGNAVTVDGSTWAPTNEKGKE